MDLLYIEVRQLIVESIAELADRESQERYWRRASTQPEPPSEGIGLRLRQWLGLHPASQAERLHLRPFPTLRDLDYYMRLFWATPEPAGRTIGEVLYDDCEARAIDALCLVYKEIFRELGPPGTGADYLAHPRWSSAVLAAQHAHLVLMANDRRYGCLQAA